MITCIFLKKSNVTYLGFLEKHAKHLDFMNNEYYCEASSVPIYCPVPKRFLVFDYTYKCIQRNKNICARL